jgi:hypothetical protein
MLISFSGSQKCHFSASQKPRGSKSISSFVTSSCERISSILFGTQVCVQLHTDVPRNGLVEQIEAHKIEIVYSDKIDSRSKGCG